jgi:hypothetical protein
MMIDYELDIEKIKIVVHGKEIDEEWLRYISAHPDSLLFHHPVWLNALESETGKTVFRITAKDENNKIVGVLPLQKTDGIPFGLGGLAGNSRLSSLPRTPLAGILADNNYVYNKIIKAAIDLTKKYNGTILQIKTLKPDSDEENEIKIIPWRQSFIYELPEKEKDIIFGNPRNNRRIKWAVHKAEKSGVTVRAAESLQDLKKWYHLYLETSRWHAVPPRSFKFFRNIFEKLNEKMIKLLLAVKDQKIIAGSLFLCFNTTCFYAFNGRDKEMLHLRPNDIIQYHMIFEACRKKYKYYDMGEVPGGHDGLAEFKKKWGCITKQIYHLYCNPSGILKEHPISASPGGFRINVWRKIPISLTEKLGRIINNRL